MSTAFAIAAVSAMLKNRIDTGLAESNIGDIKTSLLPPDKIISDDNSGSKLNLFLYRVTPNTGWNNNNMPSYNSTGERISNPLLALDLHYLITSSSSSNYQSEILLGVAMQVLHNNSVFERESIKKAFENNNLLLNETNADEIKNSELENQFEQIKISLQNLNIEEISKLWSSFQTNYRLTVSYLVTVVLIESHLPVRTPLPVTSPGIYAIQSNKPVIESINMFDGGKAFITADCKIVINGNNFPNDELKLYISGRDISDCIQEITANDIIVKLAENLPDEMYAGLQNITIAGFIKIGEPPVSYKSEESNKESFMLHPIIKDLSVENNNGKFINVKVYPKISIKQKVILLLNEFNPPAERSPYSYTFHAPANNGIEEPGKESSEVKFSIKNVEPAEYIVRIKIDGAESRIEQEPSGKFKGPKIEIT